MTQCKAKHTTSDRMKILIAEDDPVQSETLVKLIKVKLGEMSFEVEVTVVTTLKEALEHAMEANATILDATLNDATPEQVLDAVKMKKFRSPIIFLTGNDDMEYLSRCKLNGVDYIFVKGQEIGICRAIIECFTKDIILNTEAVAA